MTTRSLTLRKAAELADVSDAEVPTLAVAEGVDIGYTADELERDLGRI